MYCARFTKLNISTITLTNQTKFLDFLFKVNTIKNIKNMFQIGSLNNLILKKSFLKDVLVLFIILIFTSCCLFFEVYLNAIFLKYTYLFVLFFCLIQLVRNSLKSKVLFILLSYMLLYFIKLKSYLFNDVIIFNPNSFDDIRFTYRTIFLYELFFFILFFFIRIEHFRFFSERLKLYPNRHIFLALIVLSLLITFFVKNGSYLFLSNSDIAYGENKIKTSGLIEYTIFIFFVAFIFKPKGYLFNIIFYFAIVYYSLKNLLLGGRIEVLQLGILLFILVFEIKSKWKVLLTFLIFGYYIMSIYENVRLNPIKLATSSFTETLLIPFEANKGESFISNEGEVFSSTNRLVSMSDKSILSIETRAFSFLAFLASVILPYDILPNYAVLDTYLQNTYISYGGGMILGYMYVWFGIISIIFVPYFIGVFVKYLGEASSQYTLFYGVLFLTTMPRWFAYNPIVLIKANLFGFLLYVICIAIHIKMYKKKH